MRTNPDGHFGDTAVTRRIVVPLRQRMVVVPFTTPIDTVVDAVRVPWVAVIV
jgi:hypothetical protein